MRRGGNPVNYGDEVDYGDPAPRTTPGSSPKTPDANDESIGPIRPTRNVFVLQFYEVASLQGRVSYALMSIYAINPELYMSYLGGYNAHPYLFANMIYGYTFVLFSRISFMTMPLLPRIIWSILGSMAFNYSSMICFQYIAYSWGSKSPNPKLITATLLSFLYGRVFAGCFLSYLEYIDAKLLSLVRRLYGTTSY